MPATDAFALGEDSLPVLDAVEEFLTGGLPTHAVDRMLATVMFTDVVRSTETSLTPAIAIGVICSQLTTTWSAPN